MQQVISRVMMIAFLLSSVMLYRATSTPHVRAATISGVVLNSTSSLHISGNRILDANNKSIFLQGMAVSGPEYDCHVLNEMSVQPAQFALMKTWNINTIRVPLSAGFWLNTDNRCPDYHTTVNTIVKNAEAAGMYVLLTLAWISPFDKGFAGGAGYPMPDRAESVPFWKSVASIYANDPRVLFEPYSEVHDTTWQQWHDGGSMTSTSTTDGRVVGTYDAIGLQELTTTINTLAPNSLVLVGGIDWSSDLRGVMQQYALHGRNIVYDVHLYDSPVTTADQWSRRFASLSLTVPVVAAEFGQLDCQHAFIDRLMPYLATYLQGMIAWTWDVGSCARPAIVQDWSGTPSTYGAVIKAFYQHPQRSTLPAPTVIVCATGWNCNDVGASLLAGGQSLANGRWSLSGGGTDIWATRDGFHFVAQSLAGNGTLSAQIANLTAPSEWAKAGLMFRQSNSTNSAFYAAYLTTQHGIAIQYRTATNAQAIQATSLPTMTSTANIRIQRSGQTFSTQTSSDGTHWTTLPYSTVTLVTSGALQAGMAITAHGYTEIANATFDAVTLTPTH